MKRLIIFAVAAAMTLCGCAKVDVPERSGNAALTGLKANVYYDESNLSLYRTVDLLSGMHVSGDVESYSFTFPEDRALYNETTLSRCRIEATIPVTAVLEMTDSDGKPLGCGVGGWQNLYNSTLYFRITAADGSTESYEIFCRCR